jgi:hypothetical protein
VKWKQYVGRPPSDIKPYAVASGSGADVVWTYVHMLVLAMLDKPYEDVCKLKGQSGRRSMESPISPL